ncbi:MAG: MFS transporter [Sulfurimonas sp.]|jgi:PPP family 3-phenylpropionic acid transporter|nr:MFS transporter [Sulfurimonadaceae bacterium]
MQILLAIFYFFYFSIIGVYIIFLPKVLSLSGYSSSEIGVIFASAPLVRFIVPFAFIKGLKINRTTFNLALFIMSISAMSFYFSLDSFYKLLISNISFGVGLSLVLPYMELVALEVLAKERYGKIRLFGSIGFVLVALVLVRFLNPPSIALLYLLVLTLLTVSVAFVIATNTKELLSKTSKIANDIDFLKDYKLWLGFILMQVSFGSFYNFFTIYTTDHGISLDTTVYLWSFGVAVEIIMLFSQARLLKNSLLRVIQLTTLATALRWFLVFAFSSSLGVLFLSQAIHALSFALFHSASIAYLFTLYKHKSLAQQMFSGMAYGFGAFLGAISSGYIYEYIPEYLFLVSSFIALMATYFLFSFRPQKKG